MRKERTVQSLDKNQLFRCDKKRVKIRRVREKERNRSITGTETHPKAEEGFSREGGKPDDGRKEYETYP